MSLTPTGLSRFYQSKEEEDRDIHSPEIPLNTESTRVFQVTRPGQVVLRAPPPSATTPLPSLCVMSERSASPDSPYRAVTRCQGTKLSEGSSRPADMEPVHRGLGRCVCCFWLAVAFDIVGLLVLLIGVFVNVFFYDLLIYAGAIVIFLSLIWWVFWYSGNIEVPPAELEDDVGLAKKDKGRLTGLGGAVRRLSSRVSSGIRSSLRRTGAPFGPRAPSAQRSTGGPQVAVSMATMTAKEDTTQSTFPAVASCDVEMPHTTTESSPT